MRLALCIAIIVGLWAGVVFEFASYWFGDEK